MTDKITPAMQAFWANDPAPHDMGVELIEAREGRAELRLALQARHLNGHKTAHGGVVHLPPIQRVNRRLRRPTPSPLSVPAIRAKP